MSNRSRSGSASRRGGVRGLASAAALLLLALAATKATAQQLTFTHLAGGVGGPGWFDGAGSAARFNRPFGVAADALGNVYVADSNNHTIRKVTPAGEVTTFAGLADSWGSTDGTGSVARFGLPQGVAVDGAGNVYVADTWNDTIRKVTPAGVVTTLAGLAGSSGSAEGTGSAARFNRPYGVAVDALGNVYVADTYNHTIRKVTPAGVVTTLAGLAGSSGSADGSGSFARFEHPMGVAVDALGNLYVADHANNTIRKVTPAGVVTTLAGLAGSSGSADGTGSSARFWWPSGAAVDASGNVYVADGYNYTIRKVTPAGVVTTFAGTAGSRGSADGAGSAARFEWPLGVGVDASGSTYVADNVTIRKVTPAGVVTTLAGARSWGFADGTGSAARFSGPWSVAADALGNVYVADAANHTIRKVTPAGVVTTLAGLAGSSGSADGTGSAARFCWPSHLGVDASRNVYVADAANHTIRKVTPAGVVTTLAGLAGSTGSSDGPGSAARFYSPEGVAVDASGNVYVADASNHTIRKVTPGGVVTTLAGLAGSSGSADGPGSAARFLYPADVAVDASGSAYVVDNDTIRKVTPAGVVTTLAGLAGSSGSADGPGSAARFFSPFGVAVDALGNIYVADTYNHTIRKVTPGGLVTTLAGLAGHPGCADGAGSVPRFYNPAGVAVVLSGEIFVADASNHAIRKGGTTLSDLATIDQASGPIGQPRQLDTSPQTATGWEWEVVRREPESTATLSSATVRNPTFTPDVAGYYIFRLTATDGVGTSISTVGLTASGTASGIGVTFASPAAGDVAGLVTLSASAWAGDGASITSVRFRLDGADLPASVCSSSPCMGSWQAFRASEGAHTLTAQATDSLGRTASKSILVTVKPVLSGQLLLGDPTDPATSWPLTLNGASANVAVECPSLGRDVGAFSVDSQGRFSSRGLEGDLAQCSGPIVVKATLSYPENLLGETVEQRASTASSLSGSLTPGKPSVISDLRFRGHMVLIHGIRSGPSKWDDWRTYLLGQGFVVFTPTYGNVLHTHQSAARDVWQQLQTNFARFPSQAPMVVIGHSRGGVVARAMVWDDEYSSLASRISRVFTLGTPHSGTDLIGEVQTLWGLDTEQMLAFNVSYPSYGSRLEGKVFAIEGRGWLGGDSGSCLAPNDGVVYWNSLVFGNQSPFSICQYREPLSGIPICSSYFTGWLPPVPICDATTCHNFPYGHVELGSAEDKTPILVNSILPRMEGSPCLFTPPPQAQKAIAASASSPPLPRTVAVSTVGMAPSDTRTVPVVVSGTDRLFVMVAAGTCDVTVRLLGPGGLTLTEHSALSTPGVTVTHDDLRWRFEVVGAAAGSWAVEVGGSSCSQEVSVVASENGTHWLSAATGSREYLFGSTGHLSARLSGDTAAGWLGSVVAEMRTTSGAVVATVTLYDDGAHGDGGAGDGEWAADFAVPATPGWYSFLVRGAGTLAGGGPGGGGIAFQRVARAGFAALGSSNPRTGGYGFISEDTDGDGKFDQIRFTLGLAFPGPGMFRLSGDLQDGNGYPISHAVGSRTVSAAGSGTIDLLFPVRGLDCSQFSTYFKVTGLRMTAGDGETPHASIGQVGGPDFPGFECVSGNLPHPTIVLVSPEGAFPGESRRVTVSGTGIQNGATVSFGTGVTASDVSVSGGNALTSMVTVAAGASPGTRDVTITNPDGRSVTAAGAFTVASDQPPQVSISFPRQGDVLSGAVTFTAEASDDVGIQQVEFRFLTGSSPPIEWWFVPPPSVAFPYAATFDTSLLTPGLHVVMAKATDTSGRVTSSSRVTYVACGAYPTAVVSGGGTTCPAPGATVQAALTGTGPWTLTWSDGFAQTVAGSPAVRTVTPGSTTTYTLTALSDAGCSAGRFTGEATVQVVALPAPELTAPTRVQAGTTGIVASTPAVAGDTYVWTVTNGLVTGGQGTSQVTFTAGAPGTLTVRLERTTASGCRHEEATATVQVLGPASASLFHTVAPCRILDTRGDEGSFGGPALQPGATRVFPVSLASCGIPLSARSITANVTVVAPEAAGFLTLYPADGAMPPTSTINFRPGQTRANNAVLALAPDGTGGLKVFTGSPGVVHLILDVNGYFE